jgi:hypothetical protein
MTLITIGRSIDTSTKRAVLMPRAWSADGVAGDRVGFGGRRGELETLAGVLERQHRWPAGRLSDDVAPAGAMNRRLRVVPERAGIDVQAHTEQCRDRLVPEIIRAGAVAARDSGDVLARPGQHGPHGRGEVGGHGVDSGGEHDG